MSRRKLCCILLVAIVATPVITWAAALADVPTGTGPGCEGRIVATSTTIAVSSTQARTQTRQLDRVLSKAGNARRSA